MEGEYYKGLGVVERCVICWRVARGIGFSLQNASEAYSPVKAGGATSVQPAHAP